MKKLALFLLFTAPVSCWGQGNSGKQTLIQTSTEPLPNCNPPTVGQQQPIVWDLTSGKLMACTGVNTWTVIGPGSGGGGGITNFSATGTLAPFATFSVSTPTSTP